MIACRVCVQVNVESRLFSFRFGDPEARMNWVHVDNLVLAHRLAAEALTVKRNCVAVSRYCIKLKEFGLNFGLYSSLK